MLFRSSVEVTKKNREDVSAPPREGAYVYGLFMEGNGHRQGKHGGPGWLPQAEEPQPRAGLCSALLRCRLALRPEPPL